MKDYCGGQMLKLVKYEGDVSTSRLISSNNAEYNSFPIFGIENQMEAQTKALWGLKDDLKEHVSTAELREMLEANGQCSTGSENDLREMW